MSTMALRTGEAVAMDGAFFVRERGRAANGWEEMRPREMGSDLTSQLTPS